MLNMIHSMFHVMLRNVFHYILQLMYHSMHHNMFHGKCRNMLHNTLHNTHKALCFTTALGCYAMGSCPSIYVSMAGYKLHNN